MIDLNKYLFSAFAIISLSVPLAIAQDADSDVEEVVVTGSRIIDPNVISSSQIAVVDGQDIIDAGITRVEDFLNDMPQVSPGQSITNSNGSNGTATVNASGGTIAVDYTYLWDIICTPNPKLFIKGLNLI